MRMVRQVIGLLMAALVIMTGATGLTMASVEIAHQKQCLHTVSEQVQDVAIHDGHGHDHGNIPARHSMPDHDHETCTTHACPALFPEMSVAQEPRDFLLTTLIWPETSLIGPAHTDDLKRPPRS